MPTIEELRSKAEAATSALVAAQEELRTSQDTLAGAVAALVDAVDRIPEDGVAQAETACDAVDAALADVKSKRAKWAA